MSRNRFTKAVSAFVHNAAGNTAVVFGIVLMPLLVATGAAIDYSTASSAREQFDRAADSAAMEGARASAGSDRNAISTSTFKYLASSIRGASLASVAVKITNGNTVTVGYKANVPTNMLSLVGRKTVEIAGQSVATGANAEYADYYILIDTSMSMGMGATPADTNKMIKLINCALACHQQRKGKEANDTYPVARAAGVNTRIDAARTSVGNLIKTLQSNQAKTGQFRVALYPFVKKTKALFPISANLGAALNALNGIQLDTMTDVSMSPDGTDMNDALTTVNALLSKNGDGSSPSSPKTYVLLVTDGMGDKQDYNPANDHVTHYDLTPDRLFTVNTGSCNAIKAKGISLGVINLTYVPVTGPTTWPEQDAFANKFIPQVTPALKNCASSASFYFEATYAESIEQAFQTYVSGTTAGSLRFTQ